MDFGEFVGVPTNIDSEKYSHDNNLVYLTRRRDITHASFFIIC